MAYLPGKFVWFEHLSNDIAKARGFYEKLFGWNTEMMAMGSGDPYPVIHTATTASAAIARHPPARRRSGSRTCRSAMSTARTRPPWPPARRA